MPGRVEDYAFVGDMHTAGLVCCDGSLDWLCFPRFDSPACFAALLGGPEQGRWLIAPASGGRATRRRYRGHSLILETEWETPEGSVRVVDFMPPRDEVPNIVRVVEGVSGAVAMRCELVLRFDYGRVTPWVRRADGQVGAIAGPESVWLYTPVELRGEEFAHRAEFTVAAGQRVPFVMTWHPSHLPGADPGRRRAGVAGHRAVLAGVGEPLPVCGGVAGRRGAVPGHVEGAHLRADRRHRRRRDDLTARGAGRAAELGLPVLLAAGCHVHLGGAAAQRLHRGGQGLA